MSVAPEADGTITSESPEAAAPEAAAPKPAAAKPAAAKPAARKSAARKAAAPKAAAESDAATPETTPAAPAPAAAPAVPAAKQPIRAIDGGPVLAHVDGISLMAGAANVIMQLSWPAVGYGVMESKVESGRLLDHPIKRSRTTLQFLAVASMGTDEEKRLFRRGVNRAHAQVRSTDESPVEYNAFDPELQLWVAACIYRGFEDTHRLLRGAYTPAQREYYYQKGAVFGTTLQVKEEMWPATRDAFEEYWAESLKKVHIDDATREHLDYIARAKFAHPLTARLIGRTNLFITKGFLPQEFRDQMRYSWTAKDQKRFDRMMKVIATVNRRMPTVLREFPYNYLMADLRWRLRTGRSPV
ncbi:oxygenase MpaB family protein [Rhodococcus sp. Q]|uniref:oxygenase MpaB family protein n=1 Tax=Rhodococcus sp. Q TaxID=2502252 RepID=UPI002016203F|nr:oxygenase MpaB family protein [Rhodococcus sp. Q]